ncbi:MAG: hypothetical protein K0U12_04660 [Gammaproteobacteria bacterium]|nr:hypothetical protein [Gammaproteobacteria bacterium]
MNDKSLQSLAEIKAFLAGTQTVSLKVDRQKRYAFIAATLKRTNYYVLNKPDKSVIREYLIQVTTLLPHNN